jgi:hypothetical protein
MQMSRLMDWVYSLELKEKFKSRNKKRTTMKWHTLTTIIKIMEEKKQKKHSIYKLVVLLKNSRVDKNLQDSRGNPSSSSPHLSLFLGNSILIFLTSLLARHQPLKQKQAHSQDFSL